LLNINRVTLLGNLIEDPVVKETKTGTKVANFRVATSRKWKDKEGEMQETRAFHRCVVFGGVAGFVETLSKGTPVYVEGEMKYGKYDDKDGVTRYTADVNVGYDGKIIALNTRGNTDDGSEIPF
jgi:single-strand DNA-binding protein